MRLLLGIYRVTNSKLSVSIELITFCNLICRPMGRRSRLFQTNIFTLHAAVFKQQYYISNSPSTEYWWTFFIIILRCTILCGSFFSNNQCLLYSYFQYHKELLINQFLASDVTTRCLSSLKERCKLWFSTDNPLSWLFVHLIQKLDTQCCF